MRAARRKEHAFLERGPQGNMLVPIEMDSLRQTLIQAGRLSVLLGVLCSALPSARAEDELLRGPHPFIKDNELTLHAGYSDGLGENARGLRVQGDYSYRLGQTLWFDIQIAVVNGRCHVNDTTCSTGQANAADIVSGAAWKFQTNLPVVPYVKVDGGPIFLFPESTRSVFGLLARGGIGAHYYFFDWFGVGAEFTSSVGLFFPNSGSTRAIGSLDANLGVALQF
jgi:hypothetical protein